MKIADKRRYDEMFDYLSAATSPTDPESTVVFGRKDPLVAHAAGELVMANLAETIVISGGIGKDSGDLVELGYRSEAQYLDEKLKADAYRNAYTAWLPKIILEEQASNGGENARNSVALLDEQGAGTASMNAVAHATSAGRLAETLKHETGKLHGVPPIVYVQPSRYQFDTGSPADQAEARAELLRMADWPAKGWLGEQVDLPENLVDFARDKQS